jgi:hypothetical protein
MIEQRTPRVTLLTRMLAFVLLLALSGCIQMHTTVHVKKDGSGTIEQKMLLTGMLEGIMNKAAERVSSDKETLPPPTEEQLKKMCAEFGSDVRVVGMKEVHSKAGSGYVVTLAFDDINTVRISNSQKANMNLSADSTAVKADSLAAEGESSSKEKPETWFTFTMKRGEHPELVINKQAELFASSGQLPGAGKSGKASKQDERQMLAMMSSFLKGMKMAVDVVIDGPILRSDASNRIGNRIVLYSLDFDKLLAQPAMLTGKYDGLSDKEFVRRSGKNSGLKFEYKDRVRVVFN